MSDHPNDPRITDPSILAAELRVLVGQLRRRIREHVGSAELTPSQISVLLRLERDGPSTVSALARAESVRPQSMRTTVAALEAAGHVEGCADPMDGRQTIISMTAACRQWITETRLARQDWLAARIGSRLTQDEVEVLAEAMHLFQRLVDA